jgi:hypothetical protein
MKTLLIIMLFSINSYAQDTTYSQRRGDLYMIVRTQVKDISVKSHYSIKQRKKDNRFVAIVAAFFFGLTALYFSPTK